MALRANGRRRLVPVQWFAGQSVSLAAIGVSTDTTDGADVLDGAVDPVAAGSSALTDGADVLAANVGPVAAASGALVDGADALAAAASPLVTATSASTDRADVAAGTAVTVIDLGSTYLDGADLLAATAATSIAEIVLVPYRNPQMSDITTVWNSALGRGDWVQTGASLQNGADVVTTVLISLFTDRIANVDDSIPDGSSDPRGWWADDAKYPIGSRLWLLGREKQVDSVPQRARDYCAEALKWMIDDGVVTKFDITAEWVRDKVLGVGVTAYPTQGAPVSVTLEATRDAAGFSFSVPTPISAAPVPITFSSGPAPAPTPSTLISVNDYPGTILQTGDYWMYEDVWGAAGLTRGTYAGINGTTWEQKVGVAQPPAGFNSPVAGRISWKFPTGQTEVKSYPSLLAGNKPGWANTWITPGGFNVQLPDGSISQSYPSGPTPRSIFPLALPLSSLKSTYAYTHNQTPTGRGHLSYDIWLQSTPVQEHGFDLSANKEISTEIMIPLNFWGGYGQYIAGGGGRNPSWYVEDATIDGLLWHIFHAIPYDASNIQTNSFGSPWHFVVFEPDGPVPNRQLNLALFVNYTVTKGWTAGVSGIMSTATHCVSVELGVEPFDGTGDITISNFSVTP